MYMPEDDPEEFNVSTGFDGLALVEEDSNNAKLMDAARRGKVKELGWLLQNGADPNYSDSGGRTPLVKGVTEEEDEVVKALLAAGAAVNVRITENRSTPLHECVRRCNAAAAKPDSVRAKRRLQRNVAILHLLLSAHAEVDALDAQGASPLTLCTVPELTQLLQLHSNTTQDPSTAPDTTSAASPDAATATAATAVVSEQAHVGAPPPHPLGAAAAPTRRVTRDIIRLELPHPTAGQSSVGDFWKRCAADPTDVSVKALSMLEEVLTDVCIDNLNEANIENLDRLTAKKIGSMIGLLDSEDLIPDEILQKLARFASLADALAVHGTDLKLTEKKAREIVRVLDCVLVWGIDGIESFDFSVMEKGNEVTPASLFAQKFGG